MGQEKWLAKVAMACLSLGGFAVVLSTGCAASKPASAIPLPVLYSDCQTATTSIAADGLNADLFWRDGPTPKKAVILLGGSEGGKGWSNDQQRVKLLVDEGYFVVSLAYFAAEGLPSRQRRIPLECFAGVFDWLSRQEGVIPDDYAVIGASRGAELALLLASRYPQVTAVVALAPSSVVFPGPPTNPLDALVGQHSAWSCGGTELPFVPMPYSLTTLKGLLTNQRTRMFAEALRNASAVTDAAIPVERAKAALLLISFTHDQIWPSALMAGQIMDRLIAANFSFPYQHIAYEAKHCDCGLEPCWSAVVDFLRGQFKHRSIP
jgi:uncharacterized protein